ncbi:nitrite reductase, copper-containing [Comamonadaceae bacterium OH2545_COT-014]|nr:nitrite reductase, copper-containing [Comamonadaceae bacterium OH2545_COT-014]
MLCSAIAMGFLGHPAFAADPVISTTGGLPGYEVIKAPVSIERLQRVKQTLVAPPNVPEHSLETPAAPRVVQVEMFIEEKEIEVEPGVFMWAFTFNGTVPGPMIIVHEGDYVELTLKNLSKNQLVHNIDFHASTGALGAGELTHVQPGQEVVVRWKATKPGTFVYHCAPGGPMIPWHVVHGMNGAITVLPKGGLKDKNGKKLNYDKAYYIGEQDFYLPKDEKGNYKRYSSAAESMADDKEVMDKLIPTHVVFGDRKMAYTGEKAMTAKVGETVMFYHSQANRQSYPHLIGGHGEYVWERGNLADAPAHDLETWVIAGGSAGAAMYTFKQPGVYVYLNHNLIESVNLGALAQVKVDGKWNNDLMEQTVAPRDLKDSGN